MRNEKEIDTHALQYDLLKTSLDTCLKQRKKVYYFDFFTKHFSLKTNQHKKRIGTSCQLRLKLQERPPDLRPIFRWDASVYSKTTDRWVTSRLEKKTRNTGFKTEHVTKKRSCIIKKQKYHRNYNQTARPLLNYSRIFLTKICQHESLPVYPDKSNQSIRFSRNRIRKQILPTLKLFFNPQIEDSFFKFAEIVARQEVFLSSFLFFLREKKK